MNSTIKWPFLILIGISILFWYINITFAGPDWIRLILLNTIQLGSGMISTYWILRLYKKTTTFLKLFWLFLSIGTSLSFTGTLIWIFYLYTKHTLNAPTLTYLLWAFCYLFYLIAILYRLRKESIQFSNMTYFFNTMIYMVAAISISYHYLLYPLYQIEHHSIGRILYTSLFQIADLGILFFIITLFYLIQFNKGNNSLNYLVIGLFLQIVGDTFFAYMTISGVYQNGKLVDFIWTIALLFIGYSAFYYKTEIKQKLHFKIQIFPFLKKEFLFPYLSILILSILMMESYNWSLNALSSGWVIIFILIIIRQTITALKNDKLVSKLNHITYTDTLTGLSNRAAFLKETQQCIETSRQNYMFRLLRVDRIKTFNDVFGHKVGEQLIKEVSYRLKNVIGKEERIYRFSEDEFMIVSTSTFLPEVHRLNKAIFNTLQQTFESPAFELNIISHTGISIYPSQSTTIEEVQQHTAEALYQAKQAGNNSFVIFNKENESNLLRRLELESLLKNAIKYNQLSVYYQPKFDLISETIIGMEALLRWYHPKFGWISPAEFIPIAEDTGFINEIGEWVLRTATQHNKKLQLFGYKPLLVSVNVSALQFQNPQFCNMVGEVIEESRLDSEWLELEITESIVQDIKESTDILYHIKLMGIKISIDDFGTGYSSLNVLEQLPIDTLKIDKSFVDRIIDNNPSPMIKTIIDLALNLDLNVVAEGIETIEQKEVLKLNGCMIGQGYLFSRPIDYDSFIDLLESFTPLKITSVILNKNA